MDSIGTVSLTDYLGDVGNAVGVFGTAATFTNIYQQVLQLGSSVTLSPPFSISLWGNWYSFSPPQGDNCTYCGVGQILPPSNNYFYAYNAASQWNYWGGLGMSAGTTYNVVFTMDASNNMILYLNGVAQGTLTNWTSGFTINYIGNDDYAHYASDAWYQNIATWNRALSSTEVSAIYNSGTGTTCAPATGSPAPNFSGLFVRGGETRIRGGETRVL